MLRVPHNPPDDVTHLRYTDETVTAVITVVADRAFPEAVKYLDT